MTTALILSVLLVLLYRRVLHLWQNQRPGAALLTALALAAVGVDGAQLNLPSSAH